MTFSPLYPDVPVFPGVPPVLRQVPDITTVDAPPVTSDSPQVASAAELAWGIFDTDGNQVLQPDNISALEFQQEFRIEDYPLEQGAFETYNKVTVPYEARVTMTKGGTLADRGQFLATVNALAFDLNLYDIVTPEETYVNANVTHYSYRRTSTNGIGLLTVELAIQEVRITTAPEFSKSQTPSGADTVNDGSVQPVKSKDIATFDARGNPINNVPVGDQSVKIPGVDPQ